MKYPDTPRIMLGKCQYFLGSLDTISIIRCPYEVPRYSKDNAGKLCWYFLGSLDTISSIRCPYEVPRYSKENARKMPVFPGRSRHYKHY